MEILRGVLLGAAAAFYFAVMGVRLVRAIRLSFAVKRGKIVKITAEITDIKLKRLVSVKSAEAKYCLDNHEITGVMVGAFNGKISIGQRLSVIVSPDYPETFALNENQPRQAAAVYAILATLPAILVGVIVLVVTLI